MTTTTAPPGPLDERPRGGATTWYEVLDVGPGASDAELKEAWQRSLALVEGRTLGGYFLLDPLAVESARADIDAAWAVLSDPERRAAYDRSLGLPASTTLPTAATTTTLPTTTLPTTTLPTTTLPTTTLPATAKATTRAPSLKFLAPVMDDAPPPSGAAAATVVPAAAPPLSAPRSTSVPATPTTLPATASPPPFPSALFALEGEVNGQVLKKLREARGMTLDELAEQTKIRRPYLQAIEEQDLENLPSRVFLRGFLTQVARALRVDKHRLAEGYVAFVARFGR